MRLKQLIGTRILCVLSLLFITFAHQPVQLDPALVSAGNPHTSFAYALPDGSIPVICVTGLSDQRSNQPHHIDGKTCDACRISASIICPVPQTVVSMISMVAASHDLPRQAPILYRASYPPSAPPQAPPYA